MGKAERGEGRGGRGEGGKCGKRAFTAPPLLMNIARGKRASIAATSEGANVLTYVFSLLEFWTAASRQMPRVFRGGATAAIIRATLIKERSSPRDGIAGATRRCSISLPGERLIVDGGWHESFTRIFVEPKIGQVPISRI